MSKKKIWLWVSIGVVILLLSGGTGLFLLQHSANAAFGNEEFELYGEKVELLMEMNEDMSLYAAFSGKVEAEKMEKVFLDPEKGTVKQIFVSEGEEVKEGTKLFEYELAEDLTYEKDQKQVELEMAYVEINRLKKQKERLEKSIKEASSNVKNMTELEGEEVEDKESLQSELEQVNFDLKVNNLQAGQIQKEINAMKKKVESPVVVSKGSGVVQSVNQDLMDGAPYGQEGGTTGPLLTIVSTGAYLIKSEVNELLLDTIAVDDEVRITTKKGTDGEWIGRIIEIGKLPVGNDEENMDEYYEEGNPQTSKYPFTVLLEEHEGLEIGFHVNLEAIGAEGEKAGNAVVIPIEYIVQEEEEPYVWAVDPETSEVHKQVVDMTVLDDGFLVEIPKGLTLEDYVVYPDPSVKEGKKVEIIDDDTFEEFE
ncbi:efflux RND transporter periplasmic adaptor subunit [Oceanobacillus sp. Castelsardo]|uniref:efflux RND transporter periplasmic adaptor subunit n=1 Tax=Oceanobacillus sp. Castelsardo TaxID=1851204 RepID=UPI000837F86A|nr:efflux RND transporter periplasmic adaptor subunit [Oceanobacillus sp. Castelsardo]